jgi:isopentenyl-diphosphate delta-isomerase
MYPARSCRSGLILRVEICTFLQAPNIIPQPRMPQRKPSRTTPSRKQQHIDLTLTREVGFKGKTTGLEQLEFVHNALPELNVAEIDTSVRFLNRTLRLPFMVSCMTGGYAGALAINRRLAEACEEAGIAMGVGSQRQALEDSSYHKTFTIVREAAPSIPVIGNIGAAEVAAMLSVDPIKRLVDMLRADAFAVHLNPLQEFLQPEGSPVFRGVLHGIARLVIDLPVPVIVKEIGAGISADVARRLLEAGVRYIDVAGSGGTSWAGVETLRRKDRAVAARFWDWGIPTARALRDIAALESRATPFTLIASGGIQSGIEIAKCIALGAHLSASARPILMALHQGGKVGLRTLLAQWAQELRGAMFLTGSATLEALRHAPLVSVRTL